MVWKLFQITGDNRYDRVIENKKKCPENQIISKFKNNQRLIIIGSSWPEDESIILPWILKNDVKVLIAPHNVDQKHIEQLKKNLPNAVQYSKALLADIQNTRVMILDTIGHLASAYKYGTIAYVGGGFSGSLHNILEPAVFGLPVLFGPKFDRFPEAQAFIDNGFGFSVSTTKEFIFTLDKIDKTYSEISEKEISFIQENTGASDKIILKINSISN
ncbi:MAG: 3-deoxy-D-manno-octulosonic acid transferase [Flavobacteriales bacterium]